MRLTASVVFLAAILRTLPVLAASTTNATINEIDLKDIVFVVVDLETTGLMPDKDRVIELAAVRIQDGKLCERQSWLINPGVPIPPATQRIHGISTDMVATAPTFPEVYTQFVAFIQQGVLLSHNARFDRRFMLAELARHNLTAPDNILFDTLRLFRHCFPHRRTYSLEDLTRSLCPLMLPAEADGASTNTTTRNLRFHSASWDAECTAALFLKAMGTLPAAVTFSEFEKYSGSRLVLIPATPAAEHARTALPDTHPEASAQPHQCQARTQ